MPTYAESLLTARTIGVHKLIPRVTCRCNCRRRLGVLLNSRSGQFDMTRGYIWVTMSWMFWIWAIRRIFCMIIRSWVVMKVIYIVSRVQMMVGACVLVRMTVRVWVVMGVWVMMRVWMMVRAGMTMVRMVVSFMTWCQVFSPSWSIQSWASDRLGIFNEIRWVEVGFVSTLMVSSTRFLDDDDLSCLRCYLIDIMRYNIWDRWLLLWIKSKVDELKFVFGSK